MKSIYLDYNATTPIHPEVASSMEPLLSGKYGNPSSTHPYGIEARLELEASRKRVAVAIGAESSEIVFTSGGTESNNLAIQGCVRSHRSRGNHIITSSIEHPAVSEVLKWLSHHGYRITVVDVDEYGVIDVEALAQACTPDTTLVSVMLGNNEIGTVQPIRRIVEIAHDRGVLVHTDAAQALGKIPVDVRHLGVDLLSIAGHKLYAPKGVGALYVKRGVSLDRVLFGADHEKGLRPGTENVLFSVALGKACEIAQRDLERNRDGWAALRDRLESKLMARGEDLVRVNGKGAKRLPNTASVSFRGVDAGILLAEIGERVSASAGAACHADQVDMSPTLRAIGLTEDWAMGTVRFSVGRETTAEDVDEAATVVLSAVERLSTAFELSGEGRQGAAEQKLTSFTKGLGCACKIRPQYLEAILRSMPASEDPNVMIDLSTSDDAAVYQISPDALVVQTVDFLTPTVDDAYQFGAIAAANSLSDVYAMCGTPLFALNLVAFPTTRLSSEVLQAILQGAAAKAKEAGISILGGHSIEDQEPKFGLVVTGVVEKDQMWTNGGAKPGDSLILTKPIGTGLVSTGLKKGAIAKRDALESIESMLQLNASAMDILRNYQVSSCTDVTGFGLLGHLVEMLKTSSVGAKLYVSGVTVLQGALDLARAGFAPSGTLANLDHVKHDIRFNDKVSEAERLVLADAQTSGGLLAAVDAKGADSVVAELHAVGLGSASVIGVVTEGRLLEVKP